MKRQLHGKHRTMLHWLHNSRGIPYHRDWFSKGIARQGMRKFDVYIPQKNRINNQSNY